VAFTIRLIEATDKLESGFRGKSNENFGSIVVNFNITSEGVLKLIAHNGESLDIPLNNFFASKLYAQQVGGTQPASETNSGKARIATLDEVIAGDSDFTIVTPLKLLQKLEDFFSKATHLGDAAEELTIGHDSLLTQILGTLGLKSVNNALAVFDLSFLQANTNYTFKLPDANPGGITVLNHWDYLVNKPTFFFQQDTASMVWTIIHNKGKKCICQSFNESGEQVFGKIQHVSDNELQITFNSLETGYALLIGI
jgi:hypothetical protein